MPVPSRFSLIQMMYAMLPSIYVKWQCHLPVRFYQCDEELGAICIWTRISHR